MKRQLTPAMTAISLLMRYDPDLLAYAPLRDQVTVLFEFVLLLLVATISGIAWSCFWGQFLPLPAALFFGFLAFLFIALIDQAFAAADERLNGILKHPTARWTKEFWAFLSIRVSVSYILGLATSTGAALVIFHVAIANKLESIRAVENQKITFQYDGEIQSLLQRQFGSKMEEIKILRDQVDTITPQVDKARQDYTNATNRISKADADMYREFTGIDGRAKHPGPKYRAAEERHDGAVGDRNSAAGLINTYQPRLQDAQRKLDAATEDYEASKASIQPQIDAIEADKQAHLIPARQDALTSFMALQQIYNDPVEGAGARFYGRLMLGVLMVIELSFIGIKVVAQPTSVYKAMVIKDTLERAENIDMEKENNVRRIRGKIEQDEADLPLFKIRDLDDAAD